MAFVYILTNYKRTVLYVGSTVNLVCRVQQHRQKYYPNSFTAKYNVNLLVYFEVFDSLFEARSREYQIKQYSREKKEKIINLCNPNNEDMYQDLANFYDNKKCSNIVTKILS